MRIIGIDPGYDRLGVAIIEKTNTRDVLVFSDCIQTDSKTDIHDRLAHVGNRLSEIIDKYTPDEMSIETLFITKNQKTGMRVAEARGIMIYIARQNNIQITEYSPMQVKTAITGDGTSGKDRILKMLNILITLPSKRAYDDEYDAIAVALTHSAHSRNYPQKREIAK